MKLGLFAFVCAITPAVLACPNLTGTWRCTKSSQSQSFDHSITQRVVANGVVYVSKGDNGATQETIADGLPHLINDSNGYEESMTLTCINDITINGTAHGGATNQSRSADGKIVLSLADANTYTVNLSAVVHQPGRPDANEASTSECKRK